MDAVLSNANKKHLIDMLEGFIRKYQKFSFFSDDAPHQATDVYSAQRQELMELWCLITDELELNKDSFSKAGLLEKAERLLAYDADFRASLSMEASIHDCYSLRASLPLACFSLINAIEFSSLSRVSITQSSGSQIRESSSLMGCVYASPERMSGIAEEIPLDNTGYPLVHGRLSDKFDDTPRMGDVYGSPKPFCGPAFPLPVRKSSDDITKLCPYCGTQISFISKFCPVCGYNTGARRSPATEEQILQDLLSLIDKKDQ